MPRQAFPLPILSEASLDTLLLLSICCWADAQFNEENMFASLTWNVHGLAPIKLISLQDWLLCIWHVRCKKPGAADSHTQCREVIDAMYRPHRYDSVYPFSYLFTYFVTVSFPLKWCIEMFMKVTIGVPS